MSLSIALILDAIFGEPAWLWSRVPHPAVLMGRVIAALDKRLNQGSYIKVKGIFAVILMVVLGLVVSLAISLTFGTVGEVIAAAILLAHRSLIDHIVAVKDALFISDAEAKLALSNIVSRDTAQMTQSDIIRSTLESAAENMSDGVIAPAFWYALLGLPGIVLYKMINTADSMIGYKTPRYAQFGWCAARCDDVLNVIPARISAVLILLAARPSYIKRIWSFRHEARAHRSVNAGWPEAAMAYGLDLSLSGPRSYHGVRRQLPYIHPQGRKELTAKDVGRAVEVLQRVWWVTFCISLGLCFGGDLLVF